MPETAAGRALAKAYASPIEGVSVVLDIINRCEAEARALGRAEALAAVRAAVEGAWEDWGDLSVTDEAGAETGRIPADVGHLVAAVLAAIDNLGAPHA